MKAFALMAGPRLLNAAVYNLLKAYADPKVLSEVTFAKAVVNYYEVYLLFWYYFYSDTDS